MSKQPSPIDVADFAARAARHARVEPPPYRQDAQGFEARALPPPSRQWHKIEVAAATPARSLIVVVAPEPAHDSALGRDKVSPAPIAAATSKPTVPTVRSPLTTPARAPRGEAGSHQRRRRRSRHWASHAAARGSGLRCRPTCRAPRRSRSERRRWAPGRCGGSRDGLRSAGARSCTRARAPPTSLGDAARRRRAERRPVAAPTSISLHPRARLANVVVDATTESRPVTSPPSQREVAESSTAEWWLSTSVIRPLPSTVIAEG